MFKYIGGVEKMSASLSFSSDEAKCIGRLKPMDKFVGMQLRKERRKRRMTLVDASKSLGVSYQQLQKYEQARSRVTVSTLCQLSELYEFRIENFFEEIKREVDLFDRRQGRTRNFNEDARACVLVVESNPADEAITRDALRCSGDLNVLCVHDGCQALDVLKYKTLCPSFPKPNVVFLDVYIPKKDGVSVLKELKRDESTKDIPVVIVTDNVSSELATKMYKLGASGYILKTPDRSVFNERVLDCIRYWTKAVVSPQVRL